jgi:CRP-like cAMP-binding protein
MSATADFLHQIPLFQNVPAEQLVDLLRMLRPISFKAGELIFQQGQAGRAAFLIQSGTVEIFVSENEKFLSITNLGEKEIFGELALIDGAPRSASARAVVACEILCIDKQEFDYLRSQLRPVAFHLLREFSSELCQRIRETNLQINHLIVHGKSEQRGSGKAVSSARIQPQALKDESPPALLSRVFSLFKRN